MSEATELAWQQLLQTGTLVEFRILDTSTELSPDNENIAVRADFIFTGDDENTDPAARRRHADGFLFTVASLSFNDARPRGYSEKDFLSDDVFTVNDFFDCLSYRQDGIHLRADYVHGRCLKTDITVRPDGTVTLTTWGRGQTALRWLDRLQGKKIMGLV